MEPPQGIRVSLRVTRSEALCDGDAGFEWDVSEDVNGMWGNFFERCGQCLCRKGRVTVRLEPPQGVRVSTAGGEALRRVRGVCERCAERRDERCDERCDWSRRRAYASVSASPELGGCMWACRKVWMECGRIIFAHMNLIVYVFCNLVGRVEADLELGELQRLGGSVPLRAGLSKSLNI